MQKCWKKLSHWWESPAASRVASTSQCWPLHWRDTAEEHAAGNMPAKRWRCFSRWGAGSKEGAELSGGRAERGVDQAQEGCVDGGRCCPQILYPLPSQTALHRSPWFCRRPIRRSYPRRPPAASLAPQATTVAISVPLYHRVLGKFRSGLPMSVLHWVV